MALFNFTIYSTNNREILKQLYKQNLKLDIIMANITELTQKVDDLQIALDAEQVQIAEAIAALQQAIIDLEAMVAEGGTAEERQALADKLDSIKTDLEATVAP